MELDLRNATKTPELVAGLLLLLGIALGWEVYAPGLTGPYRFDDFPNLQDLRRIAQEPTLYTAFQYLGDGVSSTLGRPLTLITFALQFASWPAHPDDFIRVNILLHLLNATLLFWCLIRLHGSLRIEYPKRYWLAGAIALLWFLVPTHVATVLYIVQRMAVLAGTCMLLGLLVYLHGRSSAAMGRPGAGLRLMTLGMGLGLGAGVLAKENAAMFPLLLLVLEATLLREYPRPKHWRLWCAALLVAPFAALCGYLALQAPNWPQHAATYGFSFGQRLLTEPRVLFIYLGHSFVTSLSGARLFYDDLPISGSLLQPWTTAASLSCWILLLTGAIWRCRRWPFFSFAVLWYLAAHSLEALVPLEIAFDHRNYIAILGPILALAHGYAWLIEQPAARRTRPILVATAIAYTAFAAFAALKSTELWGHPLEQARYWFETQPGSLRARTQYASDQKMMGLTAEAEEIYRGGLRRWPSSPYLLLSLGGPCGEPGTGISRAQLIDALDKARGEWATTFHAISYAIESAENRSCGKKELRELQQLAADALRSRFGAERRCTALAVYVQASDAAGDRKSAMKSLDELIHDCPTVDRLSNAIAWSLEASDLASAKRYLQIAESGPGISRLHRWTYRKEIAGLRQLIELYQTMSSKPG